MHGTRGRKLLERRWIKNTTPRRRRRRRHPHSNGAPRPAVATRGLVIFFSNVLDFGEPHKPRTQNRPPRSVLEMLCRWDHPCPRPSNRLARSKYPRPSLSAAKPSICSLQTPETRPIRGQAIDRPRPSIRADPLPRRSGGAPKPAASEDPPSERAPSEHRPLSRKEHRWRSAPLRHS